MNDDRHRIRACGSRRRSLVQRERDNMVRMKSSETYAASSMSARRCVAGSAARRIRLRTCGSSAGSPVIPRAGYRRVATPYRRQSSPWNCITSVRLKRRAHAASIIFGPRCAHGDGRRLGAEEQSGHTRRVRDGRGRDRPENRAGAPTTRRLLLAHRAPVGPRRGRQRCLRGPSGQARRAVSSRARGSFVSLTVPPAWQRETVTARVRRRCPARRSRSPCELLQATSRDRDDQARIASASVELEKSWATVEP